LDTKQYALKRAQKPWVKEQEYSQEKNQRVETHIGKGGVKITSNGQKLKNIKRVGY
jgi:hypothetical protein